jgi:hypothetical protein
MVATRQVGHIGDLRTGVVGAVGCWRTTTGTATGAETGADPGSRTTAEGAAGRGA